MITIQQLTLKDEGRIEAIRSLCQELSVKESVIDRAAFAQMLARRDAACYVAIDDAQKEYNGIAGMGIAIIFWKPTGWQAELHDVIVRESSRGRGIGRKIVEALIGWVKARATQKKSAIALRLTSRPNRVAANELYKKFGFTLLASAAENGTNLYELKITLK